MRTLKPRIQSLLLLEIILRVPRVHGLPDAALPTATNATIARLMYAIQISGDLPPKVMEP